MGGKVVNAAKSFDVKWYYTGTGKEVAGDDLINGVPGAAGNYTAVLEGKGDYKAPRSKSTSPSTSSTSLPPPLASPTSSIPIMAPMSRLRPW